MSNGKTNRIGIVGGGLGGLSSAIQLAQAGYRVSLFEKNDHLGGKLNRLETKGFQFDLGPSIFTLPRMFAPVFEGSGRTLEQSVRMKRLDPQWRNFFEDGSVIDLYEKPERMKQELDRVAPGSFDEYREFIAYSKTQYDIIDQGYFAKGLDGFWAFMRHYGLFGASKLDFKNTMAGGIAKRFTDPRLRAIFEYFIKYVGSSAYDAPGFMNLMPNIQLEYGLWYLEGGLFELSSAFQKRVEETGIDLHLRTEVLEILTEGKNATALRVRDANGVETTEKFDAIVSNMEVPPAYRSLLRESPRFLKSLDRFEPACSGIVLHLGVKKRYPQLAHHCFFYSKDQERHFHRVFREKKLPDDPTIYLVCPTRTDPTQAPEGCENIKILPHVPYLNGNYTYEDCLKLKEVVLDKLERMGLTDLRKSTVVEDFWTPFDIEKKYYSNRGSIYGVVSDRKKNFAFKAPKRSEKYRNLFFVGGSVNPGGGMPMVVLSGTHVANMVKEAFPR